MTKKRGFAIDYDGTIADTSAIKARWIRQELGQVVAPWHTDRETCERIIGNRYEDLSKAVYSRPLTLAAPEVLGATFALYKLDQVGKIYLVTARPPDKLNSAREWLERLRLIEYFVDLVSIKEKGKETTKAQLCTDLGLDVLIDDELRYLTESGSRGLKRMLLKNGCTEKLQVPRGIQFARSWKDVLIMLGIKED